MTLLARHPRLAEALISLLILAGSYVVARLVSYLVGRVVARRARHADAGGDPQLLAALKRPLTYALFLVGAYLAVQRLRDTFDWAGRLDSLFFVFGVLLLTLVLLRSYGVVLRWYATSSRTAVEGGPAREFGPLFAKLGRIFIVLTAAIAILQHAGVNVASLLLSLGVGSLAVGLAAQDTLANMIAGFTLMLDRPFRAGDRIQLATGELGDVEAIGMRATRIKTLDDTLLVVPNSALVKERLVNRSRPTAHLTTRVEVHVGYRSDLGRVKEILADAALASDYVDRSRPPVVAVARFTDFSVCLLVVFWVLDHARQGLAAGEVHEQILRRFGEAGIEIPFPVRKVLYEGAAPAPTGGR